jgi:predicted DNA-binding transcriptional regulator YafY
VTAEKVGKPERLMNVLALLLSARNPVPFSEIAGRVIGYDDGAGADALEKRFDRDRQDLRELGVEVEYAHETAEMSGGYFIRKDATFQRKIAITREEAMLLSVAGRVGAAATGGGALLDALKGALRKLAVDTPLVEPGREEVGVLRVDAGDARSKQLVASLAEAIARGQRSSFKYRGMQDRAAQARRVSPWGLGMFRGAWYLAGFDHARKATRVFKVARIQGKVAPDPGPRAPEDTAPADFRMEDHLPREAYDHGASPKETVVLRVLGPPDRAAFSPGVKPKVVSDDGTTSVVAIEVRRPLGLVPWVLSCGGDVEVVRPAALRSAVRRAAEELS